MQLWLRDLAQTDVLAGALNGKSLLMRLLEQTMSEPVEPEPLLLDFSGIGVATASFLRESVVALGKIVRSRRSNYYVVIANPNETVRDELTELAISRGEVMMTCEVNGAGAVTSTAPVGNLDSKQKLTFDTVSKRGETDAGELMRENGDGLKHATAWNNRLSSLATMGLIVEMSRGRSKRYRPLFPEHA
jgi:hypothetical protein